LRLDTIGTFTGLGRHPDWEDDLMATRGSRFHFIRCVRTTLIEFSQNEEPRSELCASGMESRTESSFAVSNENKTQDRNSHIRIEIGQCGCDYFTSAAGHVEKKVREYQ